MYSLTSFIFFRFSLLFSLFSFLSLINLQWLWKDLNTSSVRAELVMRWKETTDLFQLCLSFGQWAAPFSGGPFKPLPPRSSQPSASRSGFTIQEYAFQHVMALHLWRLARLIQEGEKTYFLHSVYFTEGLAQSKMEEEFRVLTRMVTLLSEKEPLATKHQNPALLLPIEGHLYSITCTGWWAGMVKATRKIIRNPSAQMPQILCKREIEDFLINFNMDRNANLGAPWWLNHLSSCLQLKSWPQVLGWSPLSGSLLSPEPASPSAPHSPPRVCVCARAHTHVLSLSLCLK